ncbi:acyl-CoA dehydrogenase family protein [Actinophytocola sp.]|uniref:acyl-CoA dehydrogenase family protein n=1 Tax=Actinophytocola sp. TaxID=1872138 RepID=UPI002ED780F0
MTAIADRPTDEIALVTDLVADQAGKWDTTGRLPEPLLRELGELGLLCAQVSTEHGGLGMSSLRNGELTASVGSLCGSLRSVQTSHGMAAWSIQRLADPGQRESFLRPLTSGTLAAVGFSEPAAGSDLSAIRTRIHRDGDQVVVDGRKMWVTGAGYADLLVIVGRYGDHAAAVVVPTATPGVRIDRVADPVGCRAAGHADVRLDGVRLPARNVLGGGAPLPLLVTTALSYGRLSIAWGCVGILRACLAAATSHATTRRQSGKPLAEHQLVARHLAELLVAEQIATRQCEHASRAWDAGDPDTAVTAVLAKHVSAEQATRGAATAMQVLASAGATDGHVVARAHRDAKLMKIIEGTDEICQLVLADHAIARSRRTR